LSRVFNLRALAKEFAGYLKNSRAMTAHDLFKRALISFARQANQFQVRSLCDLVCQCRSYSRSSKWQTRNRSGLPSSLTC
jgi:hypothetical protein